MMSGGSILFKANANKLGHIRYIGLSSIKIHFLQILFPLGDGPSLRQKSILQQESVGLK